MPLQPTRHRGFPELLPDQQAKFDRLVGTIGSTLQEQGFQHVQPTPVELFPLMRSDNPEDNGRYYTWRFGTRLLCLPCDQSFQLMRYVAEHQQSLSFPLGIYAIGNVFDAKSSTHHNINCDVGLFGGEDTDADDARIVQATHAVFERLQQAVTTHISVSGLLPGILEHLGYNPRERHFLRGIVGNPDQTNLVQELVRKGIGGSRLTELTKVLQNFENPQELRQVLGEIQSETATEALSKLEQLWNNLLELGLPSRSIKIAPALDGGDYYSGFVYETFVGAAKQLLVSGGRFDRQMGDYLAPMPAAGLTVNLSELFRCMSEEKWALT